MALNAAPYIMYGCPPSLYTGKLRSYLRNKALCFDERLPSHPDFFNRMVPAVGRMVMPIVETPIGEILQDTTEIIEALETVHHDKPVTPATPKQRAIAHLLELFGDEGLLRPAMHYRWNFPEDNDDFISLEFGRFMNPTADDVTAKELAAPSKAQMSGYLPALGITDETIPTIESAYKELLAALNEHFLHHPYVLGGRPTIADFGLMGPLYAHLARDPNPGHLMKTTANRVWRWVERMNTAGADMPEFPGMKQELLPDDEIPETLVPVLKIIAKDYLPEVEGLVAFLNQHLETLGAVETGTPVITEQGKRMLGMFSIEFRGQPFTIAARHYSIWMLQRFQGAYDALAGDDRTAFDALLEDTGLINMARARTTRRIERVNFKEVWGD